MKSLHMNEGIIGVRSKSEGLLGKILDNIKITPVVPLVMDECTACNHVGKQTQLKT